MNKPALAKHGAVLVAAALVSFASPALRADEAADIRQLQEQIQALERKIQVLAQRQETKDKAAAEASASKVSINEGGLVVSSADGSSSLHLGAQVQVDSREFLNDGGGVLNNGFFLRRARLVLDGRLDSTYSYQFVPEFGNGSGGAANAATILDASLTIAPSEALQFKVGKFKTPIGLEVLQADQAIFFMERSLVSNLEPNRDIGAQAQGSLAKGVLTYSIGVFNGTPDALVSSGNSDFDNDKDVDGRLFVQPFTSNAGSPLQGLGFGVGGGEGREKTHSAVTPGYKTDGQQTFFTYSGAVYADGRVWRVSPQAYYYHGPFGALGEYVVSTINVRPGAPNTAGAPPKTQLENKAWAVTGGYVLTGEDASYSGVTPREPFNWKNRTWGAWQLVARYEDLKIDPKAFAGTSPLASPITDANQAGAWGIGLNWYLSKSVRITQDFIDTHFDVTTPRTSGATVTPQILLHNEEALTTRVQLSF